MGGTEIRPAQCQLSLAKRASTRKTQIWRGQAHSEPRHRSARRQFAPLVMLRSWPSPDIRTVHGLSRTSTSPVFLSFSHLLSPSTLLFLLFSANFFNLFCSFPSLSPPLKALSILQSISPINNLFSNPKSSSWNHTLHGYYWWGS